jgi:hypothetical protein
VLAVVAVALALPVSQVPTVSVIHSCCCPDPDQCHCPEHEPVAPPGPELRACHRTVQLLVGPQAPAFAAPAIAMIEAPARRAIEPIHVVTAPHAPPPPDRPDAPS